MDASISLGKSVDDLISDMCRSFVVAKLMHQEPEPIDYFLHIPEYRPLIEVLEQEAEDRGTTIYHWIYEAVPEDKKGLLSGLIKPPEEKDLFEKYVLHNKEVQDYLKVAQYFSTEDRKKIAEKLSEEVHKSLDDKTKAFLQQGSIKTRILGLGFIKMQRVTHKDPVSFIMEYPSLFKDQDELLYKIITRYVDETLMNAPSEETAKKIEELKQEIRIIYSKLSGGINES